MTSIDPRPIARAVQALVTVCDGAVTDDGRGFNGTDAPFGHRLAELPVERWSEGNIAEAHRMLGKYRAQLAGFGISYDALPAPPKETVEKATRKTWRAADACRLWLEDGRFLMAFPYDAAMVNAARTIPGRRWDAQARVNSFPPGAAPSIVRFLGEHGSGWEVEPDAQVLLDEHAGAAAASGGPPIGSIDLEDGDFMVYVYEFEASMVDELREIPGRCWQAARRVNLIPERSVRALVAFLDRHEGFEVSEEARNRMIELAERAATLDKTATAMAELSRGHDADLQVDGLGGELRPFQRAGVAYVEAADGRAFICDEQGTGKTVQALALIHNRQAFPAVVVCPASVKSSWRDHVQGPPRWVPSHPIPEHGWLPDATALLLSGRKPDPAKLMIPNPEVAECRERLDALDDQIRRYSEQQRLDAAGVLDVPPELRKLPETAGNVAPVVEAAEGEQVVDERLVGAVDVDNPHAGGSLADTTLAVDDSGEIGADGPVGRDADGCARSEARRENDAAAPAELAQAANVDAEVVGNGLPSLAVLKAEHAALESRLRGLPEMTHAKVIILNWDVLAAWEPVLSALAPKALVFDECHYAKEARAKRTKAALELGKHAAKGALMLCMSGTSVVNRPKELIAQLRLIDRLQDFGGSKEFRDRYCDTYWDGYRWNDKGASHLEELNRRLRETCFIRRTKAEVMTELEPKQIVRVPVTLDNPREYDRAEQETIKFLMEQVEKDKQVREEIEALPVHERAAAMRARMNDKAERARSAEKIVRMNLLRKVCAEGKIKAAVAWAQEFMDSTESKLIVFAHHRDVQAALLAAAPESARVFGEDSSAKRTLAIERFQTDPGCRQIVCSLRAAREGITLTAASDVATVELDWTPATHDQAEDRAHRMGQQDSVTCYYLLAEGTIDDDMMELTESKRAIISATLDGKARRRDEGSILSEIEARLIAKGRERGMA